MDGVLVLSGSEKIIALDAGHGSDTPGKRSPLWSDGTQLFEWIYTRKIRKAIIRMLKLYNISYYIVNPEDYDVGLTERANRINDVASKTSKQVITISIHGNAAGVESANGYEIFTSPGQTTSDVYAEIFYKHVAKTKMFRMRPDFTDGDSDKEAKYTILTKTNGPAILTESGFYTNQLESKKMMTQDFINKIAAVHVSAILDIEMKSQ